MALGGSTAKVTLNENGTIVPPPSEGHGTYIVNADCTGTLFTNPGRVMLVVVDEGKEFYQMRIDPANIVVFGTTKLVSPGDNGGNQQ